MPLSPRQRAELMAANQQEYGLRYAGLRVLSPHGRLQAEAQRRELLDALGESVSLGCRGSKLDMSGLSPGCQRCVAGSWSCLFVNGRCNARCFYCPTSQEEVDLPVTNNLVFRRPESYVGYLQAFGFEGVGLSGGEPLLTPGRTLSFLRAVRQGCGDGVHIWLYTNGLLVDEVILRQLREAGLDEIRFDIGATGYRLDAVRQAVGLIPTVTVEIPAVPEDFSLLAGLLGELRAAGVDHLNLHQLRLTPHNYPQLAERDYTFLHGEKVTVLESELTALRILQEVRRQGVDLPVNYCSFVYKNRFQRLAARRRVAPLVQLAGEELTGAGLLRDLSLTGPAAALQRQAQSFARHDPAGQLWRWSADRSRLHYSAGLWSQVAPRGLRRWLGYREAVVRQRPSGRSDSRRLELPGGLSLFLERLPVTAEQPLPADLAQDFARTFLAPDQEPPIPPRARRLNGLARWERLPQGLADYF